MNIEIIKENLKSRVSEKRYIHSENVAKTAAFLAKIYGADEFNACLSGWLHDISKELTLEEMQSLAKDLDLDNEVKTSRALLHGPAGAEYAKKNYDISEDVYNACFYHTFGRCGMSLLEKIVFVSDMTETGRDFEGVDALRELSKNDIDKAVIACINQTLSFLISQNRTIYAKTVETRNFYLKHMEKF